MNAEVAYLLARCRLILDAIERAEPGPFIDQLRQVVEDTAEKGQCARDADHPQRPPRNVTITFT
jgi:hypothetical protein